MVEIQPGDLKANPSSYKSSRDVRDVLIGEDTARPLIEASSTGDIATVRSLLEQPSWVKLALEEPHTIYYQERPAKDKDHLRTVFAMKKMNLDRAILPAATNGHAEVLKTLLDFGSEHGIKPRDVVDRDAVRACIENGHVAVFEALVAADQSFATFDINHGNRVLDLALSKSSPEVVAAILKAGGGREFPVAGELAWSYMGSRLSKSSNKAKVEMLVKHGYKIPGSGALHTAAERNALETITYLVEQGADVNEILSAETLPRFDNANFASWTPIFYAARFRKEEAMKLLESLGAKTDVVDANGRTPAQFLEEKKAALAKMEAEKKQ